MPQTRLETPPEPQPGPPQPPVHMRRDGFDPDPELHRLRVEAPVSRITITNGTDQADRIDAWLVTRLADVREVLGDHARFSNERWFSRQRAARTAPPAGTTTADGTGEQDEAFTPIASLLSVDPPEHTRLRRMLTREFTVRQIRRLEPWIETIVDEHLDSLRRAGPPADLVETFALPIPSLVICELLGVPYGDRAEFQRRSNLLLDLSQPFEHREAANQQSRDYMADLVARQRANPGEDLLGMLVREHGSELTDGELTEVGSLLLLAGHETTANMLGLGTLALLEHPEQLALLRDGDAPLVERAVEELLRYLSIVHVPSIRTALTDVTIGGQLIRAGEDVVCSLAAANRDHDLVEAPDRLDLTRKPTTHVAFGHGVHHCLGAPLARTEMRIAYPALLRRFPGLRLAVPAREVPMRFHSVVYGVVHLPVAW